MRISGREEGGSSGVGSGLMEGLTTEGEPGLKRDRCKTRCIFSDDPDRRETSYRRSDLARNSPGLDSAAPVDVGHAPEDEGRAVPTSSGCRSVAPTRRVKIGSPCQ